MTVLRSRRSGARLTSVLSSLQFSIGDNLLSNFVEIEELLFRTVKLQIRAEYQQLLRFCVFTQNRTYKFGPFVGITGLVARRLRSRFIRRSYNGKRIGSIFGTRNSNLHLRLTISVRSRLCSCRSIDKLKNERSSSNDTS
jgi:hypothetical protein